MSILPSIEDDLRTYFSNNKEVVAAFVFGSYARGRQRHGSDVDVGVLLTVPAAQNPGELRNQYTVELGRILKKDVHILILNTAGEELLRQVFSKGKCVQVNDARAYDLFRITAYSRIADFEPYRRMLRHGFVSRLKREATSG
ncbi:MAG TPA: nucleotidyltransferase domain-containing protein [Syntrophobacteraceae bacterium]|nr:nucleotidyltransferase domain-containing protein [Syntrophobacteraceae bacterium]